MSSDVRSDLAGLRDAWPSTGGTGGTGSTDQLLHELAALATTMAADRLSCGILLRPRGRGGAMVSACSDALASAGGEARQQAGDGPCLYAMRHARPVLIEDTGSTGNTGNTDRWQQFRGKAARAGIRSCYALPLTADGQPVGALILYSRQPSAFPPDVTARAATFARHAAGVLTLALRMASYADLNDQLKSSIASRAVIDQAVGVIMATEHCSQDRAFALLRSVSQNTNVKLRALAADIVTNVSGEPPRPATPFHDG